MRRAARVDVNQREVVEALRAFGRSVMLLHREGEGVPDLLVGNGYDNILLEVKTKTGKLTPAQRKFFDSWRGPKFVARSVEEALQFTEPNN